MRIRVVLGAVLLCTACGELENSPSIVLISIDSLRADRLGCYGAERDTSPAIDGLAAEGTRFATTLAPSPWTLPSHVTLFTGLSVTAHRVTDTRRRIDPARKPLGEHLAGLGYRTAAFVSSPFLDRVYGLDRGFDVYRNFQPIGDGEFPPAEDAHDRSHRDRSAKQVVDAALGWLDDGSGGPFFLFLHLWDVHYDYIPPPPYDTMFDPEYAGNLDVRRLKHNPAISAQMAPGDLAHLRALYDGEIRWVDSQLERLFIALRERERSGAIVISLVADHGEEFFEHGNKGHFKTLFDESVLVPWIVRYPGAIPPGTRVGGVAGLEDVAPTLLGLAGLPRLPEASGRDLTQLLTEGGDATRPQLLSFGVQRALRGDGWKVTLRRDTGEAVYYDLVADPTERDPRSAEEVAPDKLARLERRLHKARAQSDSLMWMGDDEVDLDAGAASQLRDLGYVE